MNTYLKKIDTLYTLAMAGAPREKLLQIAQGVLDALIAENEYDEPEKVNTPSAQTGSVSIMMPAGFNSGGALKTRPEIKAAPEVARTHTEQETPTAAMEVAAKEEEAITEEHQSPDPGPEIPAEKIAAPGKPAMAHQVPEEDKSSEPAPSLIRQEPPKESSIPLVTSAREEAPVEETLVVDEEETEKKWEAEQEELRRKELEASRTLQQPGQVRIDPFEVPAEEPKADEPPVWEGDPTTPSGHEERTDEKANARFMPFHNLPSPEEVISQWKVKTQVRENNPDLNERLKNISSNLNERLGTAEPETSEKLANLTRISDLRKAFGINDRYQLIEELFRKDADMFDRSLKTINNFGNAAEARFWIDRELVLKLSWDLKHPLVQSFLKMVQRRFL